MGLIEFALQTCRKHAVNVISIPLPWYLVIMFLCYQAQEWSMQERSMKWAGLKWVGLNHLQEHVTRKGAG